MDYGNGIGYDEGKGDGGVMVRVKFMRELGRGYRSSRIGLQY